MRFDLGPDVATIKATTNAKIDSRAEEVRLLFITPGAGQAMSYQRKEAEARAFLAGGVAPTPFLDAEVDALLGTQTKTQVAETVVAQADTWLAVGSQIELIRRRAKTLINAAAGVAEVRAIAADCETSFQGLIALAA